uniref:Non-structural maintenance of chromosomes element 1 homolog n=1 Tax=Timema tahoe TaxID=61484 RepID=A0A7R9IKP4_9NEOP|nr:unnamed protein product [Timema tahoe]
MDIMVNRMRISHAGEHEFSNRSVMNAIEKFVKAVNEMNDTILVPCRLIDLHVGDDTDTLVSSFNLFKPPLCSNNGKHSSNVPGMNLFGLYTMINEVRNQLIWGQSTSSKNEAKHKSITPVSSSSSISSNTKGHARTPSSASMASTSSATSISDVDIDTGNEIDSKTDSDDSPLDLPQLISEDFTQHLQGLYHSLEQLTEVALYLTSRYQNNSIQKALSLQKLTFTLSRVLVEFVALLGNIQESISSHDTQLKALSSQQPSTQGQQPLVGPRYTPHPFLTQYFKEGHNLFLQWKHGHQSLQGFNQPRTLRSRYSTCTRIALQIASFEVKAATFAMAKNSPRARYLKVLEPLTEMPSCVIGFSFYTKTERELYRKIVEEIIMCEEGTVSSTICVNLNTSLPTNITKSDAERLIKKFVGQKWLNNQMLTIKLVPSASHPVVWLKGVPLDGTSLSLRCGVRKLGQCSAGQGMKRTLAKERQTKERPDLRNGSISLGVRTLAEMEPYLTSVYKDYIKKCTLCHNIVIMGSRCQGCDTLFHYYCMNKYFNQNGSQRKCPTCTVDWQETMDLGEEKIFEVCLGYAYVSSCFLSVKKSFMFSNVGGIVTVE